MSVEVGGDGYGEQVTVAIYVGEEEATRVYLGETLVYDHL
jgi:hypothetical protein